MQRASNRFMKVRGALLVSGLALASPACDSSSNGSGFGGGSGGGIDQAGGSSGGFGFAGNLGAGGTFFSGDAAAADDAMDLSDACGQTTIKGSSKEVDILLVIDRSGSMNAKPGGFATDKWTALKTALPAALDPVKGGISFGLELFPNNLITPIPALCTTECWDIPPGETAVVVPVGPGTATLATIVAKLATPPSGGTPTNAALRAAHAYFTTGSGKALAGDKYVLLATDGGPNGNTLPCLQANCTVNLDRNEVGGGFPNYCDANIVADGPRQCLDDLATEAQLKTMVAAGIKTFVVGIPGSEPYVGTLDKLAEAGGARASATSPKYFAVTAAGGVDGIKQVFDTITHQLIKTCDIQLQSVPPEPGFLNVYVDGKVVPKAGPDGWEVVTSDASALPVVTLKGATCAAIEANGASKVQILYGCKATVIN